MKITVSLPDDIGATLRALPSGQVSSYVADAVRRKMQRESMEDILAAAGHRKYEHDPARAAELIAAATVPPEVYARVTAQLIADRLLPADWESRAA